MQISVAIFISKGQFKNLHSYINILKIDSMKTKIILFVICLITLSSTVSAQQFALDKKATIISGSVSFMSQGGDLFEDLDGNKATSLTLAPNINYFITKNFFIGGSLEFSSEAQGDYSSNGIGIGPQIGYAFGGPESEVFPYLDLLSHFHDGS